MRSTLFPSHLDFVSPFWSQTITGKSTVIDATCGNGKDSLRLLEIMHKKGASHLVAIDIQQKAIEGTKTLLEPLCPASIQITYVSASHETFPASLSQETVSLIVYNLGYLPGGEKTITTICHSTFMSIQNALQLIAKNGLISITCYPGHEEGLKEEKALTDFLSSLDKKLYEVLWLKRLNKSLAPSVILIHKML